MSGKILTVSVAAYHMEPYIRQTLDSLAVEEILDRLEVFVVDDGGTDKTLEIAKEYERSWPDTFHAVHKENGGYGSTVNYSIAHATGKYFRLLDGDDWFEKEQLKALVELLGQIDTDIVVTPYFQCDGEGRVVRKNNLAGLQKDTELQIADMKADRVFGMWGLIYKTKLLKKCNVTLPQRCLYTDQIYSTVPFASAKTIRFADAGAYCYRIGRDGQSVSKESRIRHLEDNEKVCGILCSFYESQKADGCPNLHYIRRRTAINCCYIVKTHLLQPVSADALRALGEYDRWLKSASPDIYRMLGDLSVYKKFALYIKLMRICRYGKLGLFFSRIILPAEGLASWA